MSMLSPVQIRDAILRKQGSWSLKSNYTLTVTNDEGDMLGFSSGDVLNQILIGLINEFMGELNRERIRRLRALDEAGSLDVDELARAVVDPLIEALAGENAHAVLFCHRAILLEGVDIDRSLWWTPQLYRTYQRIVDARPASDPPVNVKRIISTLNFGIYHFIGRGEADGWLRLLPLQGDNVEKFHSWLFDVAKAILYIPTRPEG